MGDHDIYGWLVTPPGFDEAQQYPLLLEVMEDPLLPMDLIFQRKSNYAAAGYVVFYTNPRGSTSYGSANLPTRFITITPVRITTI